MSKLSSIIIATILTIFGLAAFMPNQSAMADDSICNNPNIAKEIRAASGCSDAGTADQLPNVMTNIINGFILVIGIIAVIFIIVGGVGLMTSSGDASKVKKAKDTIIYAAIGLIICVLAYAIVNFVIKGITG